MTLTKTINGKDYEFKFGIRFVNQMNTTQTLNSDGVKFGIGLRVALTKLHNFQDPAALIAILTTANAATKSARVSSDDLTDYLDDLTEDEYNAFLKELDEELSHSNFVRTALASIKEEKAKADAKAKAHK